MGFRPDPTFYPSPRLAAESPHETFGYVAALDPRGRGPASARHAILAAHVLERLALVTATAPT